MIRHYRRVTLALLLCAVAGPLLAAPTATRTRAPEATAAAATPVAAKGEARPLVILLSIDGGINPATAEYIADGIHLARERRAQALVVELDTPGGLLHSTRRIVKNILSAEVPVIVYVSPSGAGATSAGVFITMAAHIAAMAPGTNIGAAHPVDAQGQDVAGDMRQKVENFAASLSRTIAQQRGRNVEWAENAVRESRSVTEREAVELKVVDLVASDVRDLLRQVDGRELEVDGRKVVLATAEARVEPQSMRLRQRLLDLIADPNIAYLLLMAGILGLYVEFTHPGVFFPGVAGVICLLLALAAMQVMPVNYSGLALVVVGVILLVAELFLPSFGVVGFGGIVAFVLGSLLLFETPDSNISVNRGIIGGAAATVAGFTLIVGWLVVRSQGRRPATGREGMIGELGEVRGPGVRPGSVKVFVHGEYWDAEADEPLEPGERVSVVSIEGMRLRVRRPEQAAAARQGRGA